MTARPPTWQDLIGHGPALYAQGDGGLLCRFCSGAAKLFVLQEGEPIPCVACREAIRSVADLEGERE